MGSDPAFSDDGGSFTIIFGHASPRVADGRKCPIPPNGLCRDVAVDIFCDWP